MTEPRDEEYQLSDHVLVALRRIIRRTDQHSRKLLQQFGMTSPQLVVLREVAAHGERSGTALARAVSVSLPTLSGIVTRLESRGLVAKRRSETDRRQVLVSITEAGLQILEAAPAPLQEAFTDRLSSLQDWEQTQILSVLQRVVAMMEAEELDASPILTTGAIDTAGQKGTSAIPGDSRSPAPAPPVTAPEHEPAA